MIKIALNRIDLADFSKINSQVFTGVSCQGGPTSHEILINGIGGNIILKSRRNFKTFLVGKKKPSGQVVVNSICSGPGPVLGIVPVCRVGIHDPVTIDCRRIDGQFGTAVTGIPGRDHTNCP